MKIIMKFILIIIILITSIHQINAQNNINSLFNIQQANPKFNNAFYKINIEDIASEQKINELPEKLKNVNWAETVYEFEIDENENVISSKGLKEEEGKLMAKPMSSAVTSEEMFNSTNVFDSSKILKRKI